MAAKQTQSAIINDIRLLMGLNADGSRNGNGLLTDVKTLKGDIESINRNLISIDHKLQVHSDDQKEIVNELKEMSKSITANIKLLEQKMTYNIEEINKKHSDYAKDINSKLDDKISAKSISKFQKGIIVVASTIGALSTIFYFFSKFFDKG